MKVDDDWGYPYFRKPPFVWPETIRKLPVLADDRSSQGMLPCDIETLRVSQRLLGGKRSSNRLGYGSLGAGWTMVGSLLSGSRMFHVSFECFS